MKTLKNRKASLYVTVGWLSLLGVYTPVWGQGKWSLSATIVPGFSYTKTHAIVDFPDINGGTQPIPVDIRNQTKGQGYAIGLMGRYELTPHWSFSTGLLFRYSHLDIPVITTDPSVFVISGSSHTHNYQVPILINYLLSTQRLSPYFSAGVSLDFRSTSFIDLGNGQETSVLLGKSNVTAVPMVGAGISYRLSNHFSLMAQPTISYILPKSTYISYTNYRLSLQTQLLYKF